MSKREPALYLQDILTSIARVDGYTKEFTIEDLNKDFKTLDAVVRNLEIIGEAAKNMPADVREEYPDIPWGKMVSMRNKVIHEYFGVDVEILWKTAKEDLPPLRKQIKKVLKTIANKVSS